jgi:hypothetical protein
MRTKPLLAAAALVPALLAAPVFASPALASTDQVVYVHESHFRFDPATSTYTFNGVLHDDGRHGPVVGSLKVSCVLLPAHMQHCTATATLTDQGQLFVDGTVNSNKDHFFLQITGGTEQFEGATGQVERTALRAHLDELVIHLH